MTMSAAQSDLEICRQIVARASKSFYLSSWLLPDETRKRSWALYAFCRVADDAVDEVDDVAAASLGVKRLRDRLTKIYEGRPEAAPVDRAFALLVSETKLPRPWPEALLDGMAEDLGPRIIADEHELNQYAVRVAGVVGLMMCALMDRHDRDVLARACDLGIAMQFTNIARDVGEDARRGRVYLPETWLNEAGTSSEEVLKTRQLTTPIRVVITRLLARADEQYQRADAGIGYLPASCRWAITAARHIYSSIGDAIRVNAYDSITQRARVSTSEKLLLVAKATTQVVGQIQPIGGATLPLGEALIRVAK